MRRFLASSIGVATVAALALPLAATAPVAVASSAAAEPAGSTQSLPLTPLDADRSGAGGSQEGLAQREVKPFSLVGVVWDDVRDELHGSVQVRTRARAGGAWSAWQDLETHNHDHAADPGTAEAGGAPHGSTAPLWVGDSDAVEARVSAEPAEGERAAAPLPAGLRLDLVDPGAGPAGEDGAAEVSEASEGLGAGPRARPYVGARPRIITRRGWGADERLREKGFVYTKSVKVAFVHHTASGNGYSCAQAPSVLRSIYRYHVKSSGWRDIGYNFAVDKCGNIYEGRAGGVAKAVMGAHTLGFNTNSTGIAVLGTYNNTNPSAAALKAIEKLAAWKLGLYGVNPAGRSTLVSGGGNRYKKGRGVRLNAISGHRDGFSTDCPGARLYSRLGTARVSAAHYQGRR
ncbi:N-acetylmuramoyl-L-alanine amidase [Streptomyces sp. NPDC056682]|uniref:peptidoglycan recognition protein family protein n=1 Tax=Streptomyces sp. NPDC056682 TaxID=3345909 RepID=UPI0036CBD6EC